MKSGTSYFYFIALFGIFLGATIAIVSYLMDSREIDLAVYSSFMVNGVVACAALAFTIVRMPLSIATVVANFLLWFMVIVPLSQVATGEWKWLTPSSGVFNEKIIYTNAVVTMGYLAFALVYIAVFVLENRSSRQKPQRAYVFHEHGVWVCFLVFSVLIALFLISQPSLSALLLRSERGVGLEGGGLQVGVQNNIRPVLIITNNIARPGFLLLFLVLVFLQSRSEWLYSRKVGIRTIRGHRNIGHLILISLVGLAALFLNNPLGSARYYIQAVGFIVFAVLVTSKKLMSCIIFVFLVSAVYLSSVWDAFRRPDWTLAGALKFDRQYFFEGHFNGWETIFLNIEWVARSGYSYGSELVGPLVFWVPRSIWPGKPESASIVFASEYLSVEFDFAVHNVGVSTLGSFYHSFGMLGALLFGIVGGTFAGFFDGRYHDLRGANGPRRQSIRAALPAYVLHPMLAGAFFLFLRGSIWLAFQYFVSIFLCYLLIRTLSIRIAGN